MKQLTFPHIISLFVALFLLLQGCDGMDDHYSTNPSYQLSFSTDTLSFDTIFSTVGSTTKQFMIYNRNNEPLNMERILLAGAGTSGFRMNVDGRKGEEFENIGILAKDSMFVFVEVTVDPNGQNQPFLIQDSIIFWVNGQQQSVRLEAYGQDVHLYKGGAIISTNTHLPADRPYLIYDSLVIAKDVTVDIEQGATFYFHHKANLVVYGSLKALATLEAPITFRGDRLDYIINDLLPYDRTPGQWGGIIFQPDSYENEFNHVIVRNGSNGLTFLPADTNRNKLTMNNSQVTNMDGNLFNAANCKIDIANSEFTNATKVIATLTGGDYQFTHCTLANQMTLKSRSDTTYTLVLSNALSEGLAGTLNARFDNCIIEGNYPSMANGRGEFNMAAISSDVNYIFNHCVMKMKGEEDANFTEVTFVDKSPSYRMLGGRDNKYMYDFQLDSITTVGVGMADPVISQQYPIDRYGVNRITSPNGPTIGAYEFVPEEEKEK